MRLNPLPTTILILLIIVTIATYYPDGAAQPILPLEDEARSIRTTYDSDDTFDIDEDLQHYQKEGVFEFNTFLFEETIEGLWQVELYNPIKQNLYTVYLHHHPLEVLDIPITQYAYSFLRYTERFKTRPGYSGATYVLFDANNTSPYQTLAYFELTRSLNKAFDITPFPATTEQRVNVANVDCESKEPVIELRMGGPTKIEAIGKNCIVVHGKDDEIVRAVDRLLYDFYGILE